MGVNGGDSELIAYALIFLNLFIKAEQSIQQVKTIEKG